MAIKVGRVPYLGLEPFYFDMERRGIELISVVPSEITKAARSGLLDAGPFPVTDCISLEDEFDYLTGFCFSTIRTAGSVILNTNKPIEELNGAHVNVSQDAATALHLLKVILNLKYSVKPVSYDATIESADAVLNVGNAGLRYRRGIRGFSHSYDLGEEWHQFTNLPFVFSRWMIRKDLESPHPAVIEDALYVGLQDWADGIFHISESRDNLRMHPQDILTYTQGLRYFMGVPEKKALESFQNYMKDVPE